MKSVLLLVLLGSAFVVFLSGCETPGPSPEDRANDAERQREAERQQATFRAGLPPVTNPGRDQ
jgi:hypothetical protein